MLSDYLKRFQSCLLLPFLHNWFLLLSSLHLLAQRTSHFWHGAQLLSLLMLCPLKFWHDDDDHDAPVEREIIQDQPFGAEKDLDNSIALLSALATPPAPSALADKIGAFYFLLEEASRTLLFPLPVKEVNCFLYNFKKSLRMSVKTIPTGDHICVESVKRMKNPVTAATVVPRLDNKYTPSEDSPAFSSVQFKNFIRINKVSIKVQQQ